MAIIIPKWARELKLENVPIRIQEAAKRLLTDTYGVLVGGGSSPEAMTVYDLFHTQGGRSESLIPGIGGKRLPARSAGLVLGTMARALDLGPIHPEAIHTTEFILPSLIAALGLRPETTGNEFFSAFIVGEESAVRIGRAINVIDAGVNALTDGAHGLFGATIAVARTLDLNLDHASSALGIVAVMAPGLSNSMFNPPSGAIRVHHGLIAEMAITACLLALNGITGPHQSIFDGESGYLSLLCPWKTQEDAILKQLGSVWNLEKTALKTFASCRRAHAAVYGLLEIMSRHSVASEQLAEIVFSLPPDDFMIVADPEKGKWTPDTIADRQFSLPFLAVIPAIDGEVLPNACAIYTAHQPEVKALMNCIELHIDSTLAPWTAQTRVRTMTDDIFEEWVDTPKGHPDNPYTDTELLVRFKQNIALSPQIISNNFGDRIFASLLDLESVRCFEESIVQPFASSDTEPIKQQGKEKIR